MFTVMQAAPRPRLERPPATLAELRHGLHDLACSLEVLKKESSFSALREGVVALSEAAAVLAAFTATFGNSRVEPAPNARRTAEGLDRGNQARWEQKNDAKAGVRTCSKCHLPKPFDAFKVRDARRGTLTSWCVDCLSEYHHERYVAAKQDRLVVELQEGDGAIGSLCPLCRSRFKPGDMVVAHSFVHEACAEVAVS